MSTEITPATSVQLEEAVEVKEQTTSGVKSFLAGGLGGVACVLVGQPFDLIKVYLRLLVLNVCVKFIIHEKLSRFVCKRLLKERIREWLMQQKNYLQRMGFVGVLTIFILNYS